MTNTHKMNTDMVEVLPRAMPVFTTQTHRWTDRQSWRLHRQLNFKEDRQTDRQKETDKQTLTHTVLET